MCRSVHAEANAIISARRKDIIGASLYLVGQEQDGSYVENACPCTMCKRFIINAGIENIIIRDTKEEYRIIKAGEWIENDDTLSGNMRY